MLSTRAVFAMMLSLKLEHFCSDEQKSSKKYLVKFGARYVSFYVVRAPAVNIVK